MNDPLQMRFDERVEDLRRDVDRFIDRQRSLREPRFEGRAFHVLHGNVDDTAVELRDLVDVRDVRMIERRGRTRLAHEPIRGLLAAVMRAQDLQRDQTVQTEIVRKVNLAHPAGTEERPDLVMGDIGELGHVLAQQYRTRRSTS